MSEQINRVLADRPQNFTTSEQAQARSNIGAAASADLSAYVSTASIGTSTAGITGISGTAIAAGPTYSAGDYIQISGDEISVTGLQPSGDYLTSVSRSNNLAGNGTSGSPLDLSTSIDISSGGYFLTHVEPGYVQMQDRVGGVNYTSWQRPNILAMSATGDSGSKTSVNIYTASAEIASTATDGTERKVTMSPDGYNVHYVGPDGTADQAHIQIGTAFSYSVKGVEGDAATGHTGWNLMVGDGYFFQHPALRLDEGSAREYVDITSIRAWNAMASGSYLTSVATGSNLTGDGTSGSPVGLSSSVVFSGNGSTSTFNYDGLAIDGESHGSAARSVVNYAKTRHVFAGNTSEVQASLVSILGGGAAWTSTPGSSTRYLTSGSPSESNYTGITEIVDANPRTVYHSGTGAQQVDYSSIQRWNNNTWNESGNSLSTGYGGNQVSAASQYNAGAGNWSVRTVKMNGLPDQNLYGFQARPATAGNYLVNDAGAFISYQQPYYCKFVRNMSAGETADLGTSLYPTGVTWPCRLDIVNLSEGTAYVMTDTFHGNTASLNPGETMTTYYVPAEQYWRDPNTI